VPACPAGRLAVAPAPAWAPIAISGPTSLPPGQGRIAVHVQNVAGTVVSPTGIPVSAAIPAAGHVWVADYGNDRVQEWSP
jgi:hypothetical protein